MNSTGLEKFDTFTVGEIMIPLERYPCVSTASTLRDAIVVMERTELEMGGRKSLPRVLLVFGEDGALVGIVRRRDILRGLEPNFLVNKPLDHRKKLFEVKADPNLSALSPDLLVRDVREQARRPVCDVMRPIVATVNFHDHILKAIYEIVSNSLSLLPVMRDKKVVGVVRSVELFHEIAKIVI